jgi:hypothetical protein
MSKTRTHHGRTTLVCVTAGRVLWTAFLTIEEYRRYIRKWAESGDPCEAAEAITSHE